MGRRIWDVDVAGSNPVTPTNYLLWGTSYGDRERTGLNRGLFWEHRAGGGSNPSARPSSLAKSGETLI
jgi:hypothetical protein